MGNFFTSCAPKIDLTVCYRNELIQALKDCGFVEYANQQSKSCDNDDINRLEIDKIPDYLIPKYLQLFEDFVSKINKKGIKPIYYLLLTVYELVDLLDQINTQGAFKVFYLNAQCPPIGISDDNRKQWIEYRRSISMIYCD